MPRNERAVGNGGLPCVWMTAGQLAYRLCDREFDCDHCPLDAALQGRGTLAKSSEPTEAEAPWEFPQDRSYHRSHSWVQTLDRCRVRYGVDVFAARLLDRTTALVPPPVASRVTAGEPACWALDAGEFIPLRSPVTGKVSDVNDRVCKKPDLLRSSPYHDGWLLEIECDEPAEQREDLWSATQQRASVTADLKVIQRRTHIGNGHTDLGPTLEDGGEPTFQARAQLNPKDYCTLLRDLLG